MSYSLLSSFVAKRRHVYLIAVVKMIRNCWIHPTVSTIQFSTKNALRYSVPYIIYCGSHYKYLHFKKKDPRFRHVAVITKPM